MSREKYSLQSDVLEGKSNLFNQKGEIRCYGRKKRRELLVSSDSLVLFLRQRDVKSTHDPCAWGTSVERNRRLRQSYHHNQFLQKFSEKEIQFHIQFLVLRVLGLTLTIR
jgi:hypothetical protein